MAGIDLRLVIAGEKAGLFSRAGNAVGDEIRFKERPGVAVDIGGGIGAGRQPVAHRARIAFAAHGVLHRFAGEHGATPDERRHRRGRIGGFPIRQIGEGRAAQLQGSRRRFWRWCGQLVPKIKARHCRKQREQHQSDAQIFQAASPAVATKAQLGSGAWMERAKLQRSATSRTVPSAAVKLALKATVISATPPAC